MSDERITELETKLAFMEQTVGDLSDLVYEQQKSMDELRTWCQTLAQRVSALRANDGGDEQNEHEVPPHY
ncbi:MAG: SlyX family protein [Gammaproteobacteria bacterium]